MATNASNANPGVTVAATDPQEAQSSRSADQREALQALLAFSTLNDQIRRRREEDARRYAVGLAPSENAWEYQQFVLDEVLQLVAERAQSITGADGIAIALAEGEAIICRASVGSMAPDRGARIDPKTGFSGACLVSRRIIRCDDADSDPRVDLHACRALGVRSMVAVPLMGQDSVVGLVEAFSTEPFGFTDNHVRSLNLLAELILAALKPEDEERIMRAARAATVDFEESSVDKLRQVPFTAAATAPPIATAKNNAEGADTPLEFSRENLAPSLYVGPDEKNSRTLWFVLAVLAGAILLGLGIWWKVRSAGSAPISVAPAGKVETSSPSKSDDRTGSPALTSVVASTSSNTPEPPPTPSSAVTPGATPEVLGVRHWIANGISTVAVDLQAEVQYETHRLENPDRIYFDLRDTELRGGLSGKTIATNEGELLRIRIAQPVPGTTRVVLETKRVANFSVRMEQNPYRLVIEIRGPEAEHPNSAPLPPPPVENKPELPAAFSPEKKVTPAPVATASAAANRNIPMHTAASLRIVIDAGHGGWDLGTVGRHGLLEKDLVLDVAQRLGATLQEKLGCEVVFTRKEDGYLSLEQRAELANQTQADLFVSVHANYSDLASARGVETYYSSFFSPPEAREAEFGESPGVKPVTQARLSGTELKDKVDGSRRLAAAVQRSLFGTLTVANPGIRNRGVREASYVVLTGTEMPSILTEISFVSSPEDETRLQSPAYRQQIAEALYKGISQYVSSAPRVKMASASTKSGGR